MKKSILFLLSLTTILGFTQCKKKKNGEPDHSNVLKEYLFKGKLFTLEVKVDYTLDTPKMITLYDTLDTELQIKITKDSIIFNPQNNVEFVNFGLPYSDTGGLSYTYYYYTSRPSVFYAINNDSLHYKYYISAPSGPDRKEINFFGIMQ